MTTDTDRPPIETLPQTFAAPSVEEVLAKPPRPRSIPPAFAALAIPAYRRFYLGHGISLVGTWLQAAALAWLVFDRTGDERMLGLVEAANLMPGLLVGLFAGAAADRIASRTLVLAMLATEMAIVAAMTAMIGMGYFLIWPMIGLVALLRVCVTFEMPARQVMIYEIVGRPALMNAIALNTGLFNASRVVGPALAGVCLATMGPTSCFLLNTLSFAAAIAAVLSIDAARAPRLDPSASTSARAELFAAFGYLRRDRPAGRVFLLITAFGIIGMGYSALIPSFARRTLGVAELGYSALLACTGVGATIGAVVVAASGGLQRRERLMPVGMLAFALGLATAAIVPGWTARHLGPNFALVAAGICLLIAGGGAIVVYSAAQTLIQSAVPDRLRGRIMGVWMIMFSGSVPLGALISGGLAYSLDVPAVMIGSAALCVVAALAASRGGWLGGAGTPFVEVADA